MGSEMCIRDRYEPVASKLTYGPAKAAPANRKGVAATAAIVDLIIFFKSISQTIKNLRMEILSTRILHSTQGHDLSIPLFYVMVFIVTQG